MTVAFFGHRFVIEDIKDEIERVILENINSGEELVFYLGGYGSFDYQCASVCKKIKNEIGNCETVLVTPYLTDSHQEKIKEWMKLKMYDSVLYPPLEKVPLKFAISKRNEWMISEADLIIVYVKRCFGGAYNALKYAKRKKKRIINLAGEVL